MDTRADKMAARHVTACRVRVLYNMHPIYHFRNVSLYVDTAVIQSGTGSVLKINSHWHQIHMYDFEDGKLHE